MLGETPISSFLVSRWLLYTQPVMSEGNTTHMDGDFRFCLERVKIVKKWGALKDTVLQVHLTGLTTILEVLP